MEQGGRTLVARSARAVGARVVAAVLGLVVLGGSALAAADALPDPAQRIAHTALGQVGIDVPDPERHHGPECGAEVQKNHGQYVRDDKALAHSECGKPVRGQDEPGDDGRPDKGPCQGKPPWAGNKAMTDAEVAAAKAERAALCGGDDEDEDEDEDDEESTTTVAP